MKFLWTLAKENNENEAEETGSLLCATVSEALQTQLEEARDREFDRKFAQTPYRGSWLRLAAACLLLSVAAGVQLFGSGIGNKTLSLLAFVGGLLGFALTVWLHRRKKAIDAQRAEENGGVSESERLYRQICYEMGVPHDAATVDVITGVYQVNANGGEEIDPETLFNLDFKIYTTQEKLCLFCVPEKYEIPRSALLRIRTVEKTVVLPLWNKEDKVTDDKYASFDLQQTKFAKDVICPRYHILEFTTEEGIGQLYFANYDLPILEALTGLKAEKTNTEA